MAEPTYNTPADYMAQAEKWGAYAREPGPYSGAVARAQARIDEMKKNRDEWFHVTEGASAANYNKHDQPPSQGVTIVATIQDFCYNFEQFLQDRQNDAQAKEEAELDAQKAKEHAEAKAKREEEQRLKELEQLLKEEKDPALRQERYRLEREEQYRLERETVLENYKAQYLEPEMVDDLMQEYDSSVKEERDKAAKEEADEDAKRADEDAKKLKEYAKKAEEETNQVQGGVDQAEAGAAKAETEASADLSVIALDTMVKWEFYLERLGEETWKEPDKEAIERKDYLSNEIPEVRKVQGVNPKRFPAGTPPFVFNEMYPHYRWYIFTLRAKKMENVQITMDVSNNIATYMIKTPRWNAQLTEKTLQSAYRRFREMEDARDIWNAFMGDAMAWQGRENKQIAYMKDVKSPLYTKPTGKNADGGDFGAVSLATAGGFIKTVMRTALSTGDTMTGYIHMRNPDASIWKKDVSKTIKFEYSVVATLGSGGDADDFMKDLSNKDGMILNESGSIMAYWTATSYARFDGGETYLKKGTCWVNVKSYGPSDMKWEDMDQYDEYEGKETVAVHM